MLRNPFLVDGTLKEAADVLSKRSVDIRELGAPRLSRTYFEKTAVLGNIGDQASSFWKGLDPSAQKALIGAGLGTAIGGISSQFEDKEDRSTLGSMFRGGLAGAALGGGYGVLQKYWNRQGGPLTPSTEGDPEVLESNDIKYRRDPAAIEAEAKKRDVPITVIEQELREKLKELPEADTDVTAPVWSGVSGLGSEAWEHPWAAGATATVGGAEAAYQVARSRALERQLPSVFSPGATSGTLNAVTNADRLIVREGLDEFIRDVSETKTPVHDTVTTTDPRTSVSTTTRTLQREGQVLDRQGRLVGGTGVTQTARTIGATAVPRQVWNHVARSPEALSLIAAGDSQGLVDHLRAISAGNRNPQLRAALLEFETDVGRQLAASDLPVDRIKSLGLRGAAGAQSNRAVSWRPRLTSVPGSKIPRMSFPLTGGTPWTKSLKFGARAPLYLLLYSLLRSGMTEEERQSRAVEIMKKYMKPVSEVAGQ